MTLCGLGARLGARPGRLGAGWVWQLLPVFSLLLAPAACADHGVEAALSGKEDELAWHVLRE